MMPTVITDAPDVTYAAIAAVREARAAGLASVLGIHVEGPFLDPARKGAHDPHFIREIASEDIARLSKAGCGRVMLTLAPNRVPAARIQELVKAGVRVSLGHSDAGFDDVRAALDAGATSFTHLFNAMSQLTGREPGMVGTALADNSSFIGVIADGLHVHDGSLRLAFSATSPDRFMLVTDAMPRRRVDRMFSGCRGERCAASTASCNSMTARWRDRTSPWMRRSAMRCRSCMCRLQRPCRWRRAIRRVSSACRMNWA